MRTVGDLDETSRFDFCIPGFLDSLVERETRLRLDYRNIPEAPEEKARQFMRTAAAFLELLYVTAVGIEVAHRYGAKNAGDVLLHRENIYRQIHILTKLSLEDVFKENVESIAALQQFSDATQSALSDELPEMERVVSAVTSMLRACPLTDLVDIANAAEMNECGARCQVAFDGLNHFIRRNDAWNHKRLHVVGVQYASGQSSIEDVANVLELPIQDAVALLEDHGYSRPIEHITLTENQRDAHYNRLRQDRTDRSGKPQANSARVARDVIASQRIEGINARPCVDEKLM